MSVKTIDKSYYNMLAALARAASNKAQLLFVYSQEHSENIHYYHYNHALCNECTEQPLPLKK